jgi:hypothetical protein
VDNSQGAADLHRTNTLLASIHKKVAPVMAALEPVLAAFDPKHTGHLPKHDLLAACASLGVVLSDRELDTLMPLLQQDGAGNVEIKGFLETFHSSAYPEARS